MKKNIFIIGLMLISVIIYGQKQAKIIKSGYFTCFDSVFYQTNGKPYTCEPSTVEFIDNKIFIGNDKIFPYGKSSIFSFNFNDTINCKSRTYLINKLFYQVHKFEASAITPDHSFLIFTGAYDYSENHPQEGTYHNTTIFFKPENPDIGGVLHFKGDTGSNSIDIKKQLRKALSSDSFPEGPEYLKVEGLTTLPDNKIVFGIREFGHKYDDFNYSVIFLIADYQQDSNNIYLTSDIKKIFEFTPETKNLMLPVGVSSIEYNPYDNTIWFTTSYEHGKLTWQIGTYLWYISLDDFYNNGKPHVITDNKGRPFDFNHKIEGFTFIDKNKILLIADDDRITGKYEKDYKFIRNLNEAYWCIIEIE